MKAPVFRPKFKVKQEGSCWDSFVKKKIFSISFLFLFAVFLGAANAGPSENGTPSVTLNMYEGIHKADDRDYLVILRGLIASAKTNIDISLESLAAEGVKEDPVTRILNDLMDVSKRGVKVRIFIGTHSEPLYEAALFLRPDLIFELRKNSVEVHYVSPSYDLQDRFIIVDGQWVLEGGLRWTRKSLETGLGSATLTHSVELANQKKIRLELLPLWDVEARQSEKKEGTVPLPVYLMREMKYFPGMVTQDDGDAIKIYLALLRQFFSTQNLELSFSLEDLAGEIPADTHFARTEVVWQVLKTLERLEKNYGLVQLNQKGPERVELKMILPQEINPTIAVPLPLFQENYAKQLSVRGLFAYFVILLKAQASGQSPVWLGSERNVEQDFPMTREKFRMGIDELKRMNLIEVFPLRVTGAYSRVEGYEYRYLVNRITTLSEKMQTWSRLRDQFDQSDFNRAREMSAVIEEDEDPKVIASYLDLMKRYPLEDIQSWTRHIAELPARSTAERMRYLGELLEHETQPSELAVR